MTNLIRGETGKKAKIDLHSEAKTRRNGEPSRGPRAVTEDGRTLAERQGCVRRRASSGREPELMLLNMTCQSAISWSCKDAIKKGLGPQTKNRARTMNLGPAAIKATRGHHYQRQPTHTIHLKASVPIFILLH